MRFADTRRRVICCIWFSLSEKHAASSFRMFFYPDGEDRKLFRNLGICLLNCTVYITEDRNFRTSRLYDSYSLEGWCV